MADQQAETGKSGGAYQVLARKYRPQNFDDLIGHGPMVKTLKNAFAANRIAHAYILTGVRGVGKTTTARILARALNYVGPNGEDNGPQIDMAEEGLHCKAIAESRHPDVMEMDAASRTGVGDIRELIEGVRYAPVEARYKVYIIDEVHMLSPSAFNALLKTLEEPPPNVIFILATTELHKIPATILSRTQQFDFRQIPLFKIEERLQTIAASQKLEMEKEAAALIAQASGGSMRDALSIFDQVVSATGEAVTGLDVKSILGVVEDANLLELLGGLSKGSVEQVFSCIGELVHYGHDLKQVYDTFAGFIRDSIVLKSVANPSDLIIRRYGHGESHQNALEGFEVSDLVRILDVLVGHETVFRQASEPRYAFELVFLKLLEQKKLVPLEKLLAALESFSPDASVEEKKNH